MVMLFSRSHLPEIWRVADEEIHKANPQDGYDYAFITYELRKQEEYRPLLYLPSARYSDQSNHMVSILNDGVCPFCAKWLGWYHESPVDYKSKYWIVTNNDNPYAGTKMDILLIPKRTR